MKLKTVRTLLIVLAALTLFLLVGAVFLLSEQLSSSQIDTLKIFSDVLKVIIVGLFATVGSTLIPILYREKKYEFEMRKEAKKIYSESLTGVLYLSSRLPYLKLAEEAFRHLEELHTKKHLAETYYGHLELKNDNDEFIQRRIWPKGLDPGKMIEEAKLKVMKIADNWSDMSEKVRFDYFNKR